MKALTRSKFNMKRTSAYGAATIIGHASVQEDGYYADPGNEFYLLANGLGGGNNGYKAVKELLANMSDVLREKKILQDWQLLDKEKISPEEKFIEQAFFTQHKIFQEKNSKKDWQEKVAVSLCAIFKNEYGLFTAANSGSSAAMIWRDGGFRPLFLPQINFSSVSFPAQALGLPGEIHPEVHSFFLKKGELLLIYTDGFAHILSDPYVFCSSVWSSLDRQLGENLAQVAQSFLETLQVQRGEELLPNASLLLIEG